jgi:hypothetical protein
MIIVYGYDDGRPVAEVMLIVVATLVHPEDRVVRCAVEE